MRHTGPWSASIARIKPASRSALCRHLLRLDEEGRELRFGYRATDGDLEAFAGEIDLEHHHLFGTRIDGELRGVMQISPFARSAGDGNARVHLGALSVEAGWRGRGIGFALLVHGTTYTRNIGGRHLVIDGLNSAPALRHLTAKLSADCWFAWGDCQAWFSLDEASGGPVVDPADCYLVPH